MPPSPAHYPLVLVLFFSWGRITRCGVEGGEGGWWTVGYQTNIFLPPTPSRNFFLNPSSPSPRKALAHQTTATTTHTHTHKKSCAFSLEGRVRSRANWIVMNMQCALFAWSNSGTSSTPARLLPSCLLLVGAPAMYWFDGMRGYWGGRPFLACRLLAYEPSRVIAAIVESARQCAKTLPGLRWLVDGCLSVCLRGYLVSNYRPTTSSSAFTYKLTWRIQTHTKKK